MKPYQWSILAGSLLALIQAAARYTSWEASVRNLEASSFLFCMAGVLGGSRPLRLKFEALGRNKKLAMGDPDYMRERREVQLWAVLATASVLSLLATRMDWSPLVALAVPVLVLLAMPIVNRSTGWSKH